MLEYNGAVKKNEDTICKLIQKDLQNIVNEN